MLCHKYKTQQWNIDESAAALFDNIRSAPEVLSKDDKKGWKALKHKVKQVKVESEFRASEMKMTEAQRLEVMQMVASGGLSIDAAMAKVLAHEQQHAAEAAAAAGGRGAPAGASGADESGGVVGNNNNSGDGGGSSSVGTAVNPPFSAAFEAPPTFPPPSSAAASAAPTTPRLRSNPAAKTPQPSRPAPPASGSSGSVKKKQPPRPNRRPAGHELKLEGLTHALPTSSSGSADPTATGPPSAPAIITASQVTNPFGITPPPTPPHSAGASRPESTNPFL